MQRNSVMKFQVMGLEPRGHQNAELLCGFMFIQCQDKEGDTEPQTACLTQAD